MRILVTGTGRGGTTLLREVVVGLEIAKYYCNGPQKEEDRHFFFYDELPASYLAKLASPTKGFNVNNFIKLMRKYSDLYILFSIRHPVDTCMSKIVRGRKASEGGDKYWESVAVDGTVKGAVQAVREFHLVHDVLTELYPARTLTVRMEELILHPRQEVERVARFFNTEVTGKALKFYERNTNRYQFRRYGTVLDRTQVGLYKRWETVFDGYFKDKEKDIELLKEAFKEWCE